MSTVALSTLVSGCVGTGPNTQQGAVTGGTLGAIAGGIIEHNRAGGDTLGGAILGATLGAIAGGTMGNTIDNQRGTLYGYPAERGYYRTAIESPPPPSPHVEKIPPSPVPNAVWVPGYWLYNYNSYTWVAGRWEIPPQYAHAYVTAHWEYRGGQYVYVPSYWQ